jgi:hypothetical protein
MKKFFAFALLLALIAGCSPAQQESAAFNSPVPTPPAPGQPEPPALEDPTDIREVVSWLVAGGAGPALAFFLAKQKWFNDIKEKQVKVGVVISMVVGVPLLAKVLIDFVPPTLWDIVQPYWRVGVGALLIGWPASQVFYEHYLKDAE